MEVHAQAALSKGAALEPYTFTIDSLQPNEAIIKVIASGVCHSDLNMIDDDRKISSYPMVPGHEVVGEVVEVGSEVHHLKPGDRVGTGWVGESCHHCHQCQTGHESLCDSAKPTLVRGHGGFADYMLQDARFLFKWPEGLDPIKGSPLLCAGNTVYPSLRYAGMTSGQRIGIIGVGGLGHLAVQFASKLGNRVTVFTTSQDKADFAGELGAEEAVVVPKGEQPQLDHRLDIILSTAPAKLPWDAYINLLEPQGTMLFVSNPMIPLEINVLGILAKRRRVMGSPAGGRPMMNEMLRVADEYGIEPVVETFPLAKVNEALDKVRNNTIRYRGVVVA